MSVRLWSLAPKLATAAFVIAIPVFLVTANVRFLVSDVGFYEKGLRDHNAVEATGIALPELDRASQEIIDYFENEAATLRIVVLNQGQEEPLFNSKEVQHMQDVKRLMRFVFRLNEVSLVVLLSYICCVVLWTRSKGLRSLARESLMGVGVALMRSPGGDGPRRGAFRGRAGVSRATDTRSADIHFPPDSR